MHFLLKSALFALFELWASKSHANSSTKQRKTDGQARLANFSDFFRVGLSWSPIHGLQHGLLHVPDTYRRLVEVRSHPPMGAPIPGATQPSRQSSQRFPPLSTAVQSGLTKVCMTGGRNLLPEKLPVTEVRVGAPRPVRKLEKPLLTTRPPDADHTLEQRS